MNEIAESYVKLVLAVGAHDPDYVDAYYGPEAWRQEAAGDASSLDDILSRARRLHAELSGVEVGGDSLLASRHRYLTRHLESLIARVEILGGKTYRFDDESLALYDAVAPHHSEEDFEGVLAELGRVLPGRGPVRERLADFRRDFVIPPERLDTVFTAAIHACRERTLRHIALPEGERFRVEYVTDKSWSGYNWYQGDLASLIQVNTDLPIHIDRAIDLACHEGYPGHHVFNALLERHLVDDLGWMEFSVYPLFSPRSLIAEGTANYGIDMAFPGEERVAFERSVLFPLAGLDPSRAGDYYRVMDLLERLDYAGNEAARRYLNGEIDTDSAAAWLGRYALMTPARARQRVRFFDQYRSYVINYNLGQDMVARYVESRSGGDPDRAWELFGKLLSQPWLPSELVVAS